jgi:hypothetical protein
VGDWVLFMHSTVIWVYGCHKSPYLLPIFMNPRIFYLEFIRQRIISETKNFMKLHKASNLKFPFIIGPFVVKSRSCLSQFQEKIKEFGFSQLQGRRYDPHQIISNRRLMKKHAPYEHEHVEGFEKLENLELCVDMETILQPIQTQQVEATLLHVKITHFDSVASIVITSVASVAFFSQGRKCRMLLTSVASVKESILP